VVENHHRVAVREAKHGSSANLDEINGDGIRPFAAFVGEQNARSASACEDFKRKLS
jgi:hypothetical protein